MKPTNPKRIFNFQVSHIWFTRRKQFTLCSHISPIYEWLTNYEIGYFTSSGLLIWCGLNICEYGLLILHLSLANNRHTLGGVPLGIWLLSPIPNLFVHEYCLYCKPRWCPPRYLGPILDTQSLTYKPLSSYCRCGFFICYPLPLPSVVLNAQFMSRSCH